MAPRRTRNDPKTPGGTRTSTTTTAGDTARSPKRASTRSKIRDATNEPTKKATTRSGSRAESRSTKRAARPATTKPVATKPSRTASKSAGVGGQDADRERTSPPPAPKLSLAAPCFNEAEGIESVLREWNAVLDEAPFESEIVLCDDGSTDGTGDVLKRLQDTLPRLRVVTFEKNGGYGRALRAAIAATRGEYVATLDSDGQFDARDALRLLDTLERKGLDAITGYRARKNDTPFRVLADRGLNQLVRRLFDVDFRDTNCALKVARGALLRSTNIEARGYPTPTELVLRLQAAGARIGEAPVDHRERVAGASKLHPLRTAWGMLRFLLYLRARLALYRANVLVDP